MQTELLDIQRRLRTRFDTILAIVNKAGYDIRFADGCSEPGDEDKPIVLGNWNERTRYDCHGRCITNNDTMPRIAKILEKLGYQCEWEDEWAVCDECGKAIRIVPNSYSWKPSYWSPEDCGIICHNCVKANPEYYLEWLNGNEKHCLTLDIDLTKYGYSLYRNNYENGWHDGQDDDPAAIAEYLRGNEITDFIFVLDSVGQFDINFSVWVKQ